MNFDKIILDNGLTIYFLCDKTKHVSLANLIVNFGGIDTDYIFDNKKKKIKSGVAHFLEHTVLESTKYEDLMNVLSNNGVRCNGLTTIERTEFYIDTVNNFIENLKILIDGVHNPIFDIDKINNIRKPILEEKRRSLDNKYSNLYNTVTSTYLNNKNFKSILGDIKDINCIDNNDLEDAFKAFYRPSNEILVISGNFDKNSVLEAIKACYDKLNFDNNNFKRFQYKKNDKVNKKNLIIKDNTNMSRVVITYKIYIDNIIPSDKLKLDTYIYSFLRMNFGVTSKINKKLIKDNIIIGNVIFVTSVIDGYYIIRIEANTNKKKLFVDEITSYIQNKTYVFDKELFELYKKGYIIDLIVRNDNIYNLLEPFIQNIIFFKYEGIDDVKDIESMTFKEYKYSIKSLDLNNYSIVELKQK